MIPARILTMPAPIPMIPITKNIRQKHPFNTRYPGYQTSSHKYIMTDEKTQIEIDIN